MTFRQCAEKYIASHESGWRNDVHRRQWPSSLERHVYPVIGDLPVHSIDTALVTKVIEPIWTSIPETASRVRGRIESILDWAKVRGFRMGDNAARYRGHLDKMLPARAKVRRVEHHAALPYAELPGFMAALREQQGIAARALEFLAITAARAGEVLGAKWNEIDLAAKTWTVPAKRMKANREHRVPLAPRALAILEEMQAHRHADEGFVFPGSRPGRPLNQRTFFMLLRRMDRQDITTHGFRSTFSDWSHERTSHSNHAIELSLAHSIGAAAEKAYRRGDMFEKRRKLMEQWGSYCAQPAPVEHDKVVPMQRRG